MRIDRVTLAGVSNILYHATTVNKLNEMLKSNEIHLVTDLGTTADKLGSRKKFAPYYFSTSRVKFGGYLRGMGKSGIANLVLDGRALSQNMHGHAVDYWGPSYRPDTIEVERRLQNNENEDRLFSDKPVIKPLKKYVIEIHVVISSDVNTMYIENKELPEADQDRAMKEARQYRDMRALALAHGIALYFYSDYKAFTLLDKRKVLDSKKFSYTRSSNDLGAIVELFEHTRAEQDKLSKAADDTRYNVIYTGEHDQCIRQLETEFHNAKNGTLAEKVLVDKFVHYMKINRLRSIRDVVVFLGQKYKE
jgi:hypothetical protein